MADSPALTARASLRGALGWLVTTLTAAAGVLFGLALWNPWRLVALDRYFGNPLFGVVVVCIGAYLGLWLLAPVRNEAAQPIWLRRRVPVLVIGAVGLFAWALLGDVFDASYQELVRSADGQRTVVMVTQATDDRQIARVWDGAGLLARDTGE